MAPFTTMFLVSLTRPTAEQEAAVCEKGRRLGFNYGCVGSTRDAPPLPPRTLDDDGWWALDTQRVKVGYGKATYDLAKRLVTTWQHFQLPWAQVAATTAAKPGAAVCVAARVGPVWTAVPLQIVYRAETRWRDGGRRGERLRFACGTQGSHFLAGEERFGVEWDRGDDSVWFDIYTISRPAHPFAVLGYPLVRALQAAFRAQSARALARRVAVATVDDSLDESVRRRLVGAGEALEGMPVAPLVVAEKAPPRRWKR